MGPLNAIVHGAQVPKVGTVLAIDISTADPWKPAFNVTDRLHPTPSLDASWRDHAQAQAFLRWIGGDGEPEDALVGMGPGLTPAGDDFVGGAMIALRAAGHPEMADRIAAWALPLAATRTSRISRAHLECAAAGEGHEALHLFLSSSSEEHLEQLARIGHTSGLDAAAGAVLSLERMTKRPSTRGGAGRSSAHLAH
jgi:hypothetical protein